MILSMLSGFYAAGQFPPAAGQPGSTAIHADSSCFVSWANNCIVERGYVNISDTNFSVGGSNRASYGMPNDATGKADNNLVSLGDKGVAILTFEFPIVNGPGWDFAVFENGLNDNFLELAFVEVSSNGVDFFRFPSVSLSQTNTQTGSFGETDPTKINNLAGKYRVMYGTPFDLDDMEDNPLLDKNHITHVKVIDVCGSINPLYACYDFSGNIINDPFPTPFASSGFDLDAVGVLNNTQTFIRDEVQYSVLVFPNPADDYLCVEIHSSNQFEYEIFNANGILQKKGMTNKCIEIQDMSTGFYFLRIASFDNNIYKAPFYKL